MPVIIADEKDIPLLVALMNSAYRGEGSKKGWTSEADLFAGNKRTDEGTVLKIMNRQGSVFFKYENDPGSIEGCVMLHKKENRLYLGMFSVSPHVQGKGIGKELLSAAEDHAKEQNCNSIFMTVISVRKELIAWYERHGYQNTGKIIPFPIDERFGVPKQPLEMVVLEKFL